MNPQVLITSDNLDIYKLGYVSKIIKVTEKKTFKRDKLIVNEISMNVKNFDNFFSVDNSTSIFNNSKWRFSMFKIINADGEIIWDGVVKDITRDHRTKLATIKSTDLLYKFFSTNIDYTSSDWETPATAFKNICDNYGFTAYNEKAVNDSISQYENANCDIKCYFDIADNTTFQQAIEKLGEIGCADVYTHKNEIHFTHWQAFTGGTKVKLIEKDLLKAPMVWSLEKEIINNYNIRYFDDSEIPATDDNNNNIGLISRNDFGSHDLKVINGSNNNQIVIKDEVSAVYIGECYERRTHKNIETQPSPITAIQFSISGSHRDWIDLETYFSLTLSDESWDNKIFEIFQTVIDYDRNVIDIIAYEI